MFPKVEKAVPQLNDYIISDNLFKLSWVEAYNLKVTLETELDWIIAGRITAKERANLESRNISETELKSKM